MFAKLNMKYYWRYPEHQKWGDINYTIRLVWE